MKDLSSWIASLSPEQRTLFNLRLQNRKPQLLKLQPIARRTERGPAPLTYEQERLWFIQQLFPSGAGYNINTTYRFSGRLDLAALARSFAEVLRRHDILRTSFITVDGQPVQAVSPEVRPKLPAVDLRGLAFERREAELMRWLGPRARQPFDLAAGEPVRLTLFQVEDEDLALLATMHHIVTDWWSFSIFQRELMTLYGDFSRGRPASLPELPIQYADFAAWQRQWMRGEVLARQLEYWRRQLAGVPTSLELSTDRPRPAAASFRGYRQPVEVSPELADGLRELVRREDATLFTTLVAAYGVLLRLWSGQEDILIGTPIADRGRPETEVLIGYFLNLLILRADLTGGPTFQQVVDRVREMVQGAYANQDLPFGKLLDELKLERHLNRMPLFQVAFVYVKIPEAAGASADASLPSLSGIPLDPGTTRVDMTLVFEEMSQGARCFFEYSRDVFDAPTMARMAAHFERLLAGVIAHPERPVGDLALLSEAERWAVLGEWNDTAAASGSWVVGLFEEQAGRAPDAVALVFQGQALSYAELNRASNRLAHYLRRLGVGPERLVGLGMDRSLDLVTACLAVLKAGGAYLPLDPSYPRDRLGRMLEDSGAAVLLTRGADAGLFDGLPAGAARPVRLDAEREAIGRCGDRNPGVEPEPEHLAYVLFTSGSTGRPKGVEIPHRALSSFLQCARRTPGFTAGQRFLAVASFSFDASVPEIFLPLVTGGCAELLRREDVVDGARLAARFAESGFDMVQATPSAWLALVEMGWRRSGLAKALCSAEALPRSVAEAVAERAGEAWNLYGPTETTVWATGYRIERGGTGMVPLGRPLGNTRVHMLDRDLRPSPVGVPGEVYIGGGNLARGYRGRPELTAERFVPDPFGGPGERLYRTGDLARHRPDGTLEFLGRADHQLKVRGYRIEPGEVEAVLVRHPAVREAVVLAREEREGQRHLAAYLVLQPDAAAPAIGELRARLGRELPEYMVPSLFVVLPAMPRMPNGKVDRQALLRSAPERLGPEAERVAPRTPTEEVLATLWSSLLEIAELGVHDNFFESGGHSLLGTRLMARLRQVFGVDLPLRALFEAPTVAGLAARIDLARMRSGAAEVPPLHPLPRPEEIPLSFAQERLWFLDQLTGAGAAYNIPVALTLAGALDPAALERSFAEVVRRHESLRTVFETLEGRPVQRIAPDLEPSLPLVDLSALPEESRRREGRRLAAGEAARGFDLARGPLLRVRLLRLSPVEHACLLNMHHIVSDGWSMGVLVQEVAALYAAFSQGRPSPLPPLPVQYADFVLWQRQWLTDETLEAQASWWREELAGASGVLDLPADRPRPAVQSYRGDVRQAAWPGSLGRGLRALGLHEGATPFMVLMAGFQALLHRLTGQDDVLVGTPLANRVQPELEGLIGLFANTLVLRGRLGGAPAFRQLLGRVRETALGAYAHQDLPFERLVEELRPERDLSRSPLFQLMLALQNTPAGTLELPGPGLSLAPLESESRSAKFDLTLSLVEAGEEIASTAEFSADLFDGATIVRLLGHFRALLESAAADPDRPVSELELLSKAERWAVLGEWNDAAASHEGWVIGTFEEQAERAPDAAALAFEDQVLSYAELNRRSNRLAHHLRRLGIGPDRLVGLGMERSPDLVTGCLAVLKAGGAYLPLDPTYPRERLERMLEDAGAALVLTGGETADGCGDENPGVVPASGNLAYVLFTSGSTGRPKGVEIPHGALINFLRSAQDLLGLAAGQRLLAVTSLSFDISVLEIFLPLMTGGCVELLRREDAADGARLAARIAESRADGMQATPATWRMLVDAGWRGGPIAWAISGAEALPRPLAGALAGRVGEAWNFYGPTETTVWSTAHRIERGGTGPVPLGRPLGNTWIRTLDPALRPVPVNVPGEVYIGGAGLARGYRGRPDLTAERFVPDPFGGPGERLYRTGDLARHRPDGALELLGRIDHQLKVRGFRIEPGEVEAALVRHPGVREAVVVARERGLAACVVLQPDTAPPSAGELRSWAGRDLPDYMLPSLFVVLPEMPRMPNGKVDRQALLRSTPERLGRDAERVAPRTPTEDVLAALWSPLLETADLGVHDNFFEAGGHSLMGTRLMARIRQVFGVELPLRALFEAPTIAGLAARIGLSGAAEVPPLKPRPRPRPREIPLSFAQERLWLLDQLASGGAEYNMPVALTLTGSLDVAALERTCAEVVRRHESLRTTFELSGGGPVQRIAPDLEPSLPVVDLSGLPVEERHFERRRLTSDHAARPFDLARGPLLRFLLLRSAPAEHACLLNMHHIVSDGWSMGVLVREVAALYAAFRERLPSPLPPLPVQYADFALWQREWLRGEVLEEQVGWWRQELAGASGVLELPADRPRPPLQGFRGSLQAMGLPAALGRELRALGLREGATPFMVLLTGFQALLHRLTGQDDVLVGTPVANRVRPELEDLVGFFANTLVMRGRFGGEPTFRQLLGQVRETALGVYAHQDLPFERLVEELRPERDLSRSPLFQVMLVLQNAPLGALELPGLSLAPLESAGHSARFDLALSLVEAGEAIAGSAEYSTDLFDRPTIVRLLEHLRALLESAVSGPDRGISSLELLTGPERHQLLEEWNDTRVDEAPAGALQRFEAQAARTPGAEAVVSGDARLTYGELDRRANGLARRLREMGVEPGFRVGLAVERSPALAVGLLGIWKAGGACVPMDPSHPQARLSYMREDADIRVVVTREHLLDLQGEPGPGHAPAPRDVAYLIYTSGTTGQPKAVVVEHRQLASTLAAVQDVFGFGPGDRMPCVAPFSFDIFLFELLGPLLAGGTSVLMPLQPALDVERLADELESATLLHAVPALMRQVAEAARRRGGGRRLRALFVGGDAVPAELLADLRDTFPRARVWVLYGPTEAAIVCTAWQVPADGPVRSLLGRPLPGATLTVRDGAGRLVPAGVPGEIWIGGSGVARGYWRREELTAGKFVEAGGERFFRSGDLARRLADGTLEFLRRTDRQVKVRGFRIEPGEVEAALAASAGVREAVVAVREDTPGGRQLVAYVVGGATAGELRRSLRERLPDYMVPAAFVTLAALPLTVNGKVDREGLPAPERQRPEETWRAPRGPAEERLAAIWDEVLGLPSPAGAGDDFFVLGGHSLLATQVVSRVRESFGVELPLRALFESPRLSDLASEIETAAERLGSLPEVRRTAEGEDHPLSYSQERLWFLDRLTPGSTAYNIPAPLRIRGPLDLEVLERCFEEVIRRHESLRTRFAERDGTPVQIVDPPCRWRLPEVDLTALPETLRGPEAERWLDEEAGWPFDLTRGPLLRTPLLRVGPEERLLLLSLHHIVSDGWSIGVLVRELTALYRAFAEGRPSPLPELPLQYADFARWQRERLSGPALEAHLAYWRERLAGSPPSLDLPLDRPRPALQTFRGSSVYLNLEPGLTAALRALSVAERASLFMVLLAAFKLLLRRWSGQEDIVVGAPVAGRDRRELEGLIGFFLNSLALRTDFSGRPSFRGLVRRERATVLGAFSHQEVPFEKLLADLQPERDLSRTPLFQVFFNMLNFPGTAAELPGGVAVEPVRRIDAEAKFDITVYATDAGPEVPLGFVYNADLFDRARIEEMARQFRTVLAQAVANPDLPVDRVSLLTPEAVALLPDPAAPLGEEWHGAVHELFAARARRHPERLALIDAEGTWTYGELSEAVGRLAARLRDGGVGHGDRVAIYSHRSAPVVWAVLATLEAGAAFVLLDPAYPAARLAEMVRLAAPRAWLEIAAAGAVPPELEALLPACRVSLPGGGPEGARDLLAGLPPAGEPGGIGPDDIACIAFTSGSTGTPKGILGRHGPLSHFLPWQCATFGLGESDRYSMLSGLAHDPLQRDMFTPLSTGATLCIPTLEEIATPGRLAAWMARQEITVVHLTPAMGQILTEPGPGGEIVEIPTLRYTLLVGDVLTWLDVHRIRRIAPRVTVVNLYGSTETQRAVGFHVDEDGGRQILPLGRGMRDVQLLVVSGVDAPALAGVGEVGEIWVRSPHLAKGYLGDEALTAERFRTNPFTGRPGDRVYRTGDLGRYLPDGQAVFAGRADQQVKIRGFRIELGEIEATLGRLSGVREAVVLARQDSPDPGARRLVAYVVPDPENPADVEILRDALRKRLPAYMVPAAFVCLDRLPVTPNGKVDRRALPAPEGLDAGLETAYVEPENDLERTIAAVWREVLGLEKAGVRHNFFDLGGHSLLLVRLHARLQEALQRDLSLIELFNYPSIRALAEHLGRKTAEAPAAGLEGVRDRARKQIEAARRQKESVKARRRGG